VRFPLPHDVDAASVTYLRDFDLIARAVDSQFPATAAGRVGRLTVLARLRPASACTAEPVRAHSTLSREPTAEPKVRVNARLHSVPLAAVCCNSDLLGTKPGAARTSIVVADLALPGPKPSTRGEL
jgi:hypothetical protein